MEKISKKQLILLILTLAIIVIIIAVLIWQNISNENLVSTVATVAQKADYQLTAKKGSPAKKTDKAFRSSNNISTSTKAKAAAGSAVSGKVARKIFVHVAGEVVNSGVYQLNEGSRIFKAIEAAGGATSLANLDSINLAAPLVDGQKVYIPSLIEKINQLNKENNASRNTSTTTTTSNTKTVNDNTVTGNSGKINLNTASAAELEKLSGIGPNKASSIIKYREKNGYFTDIDELVNVSGIGTSTLAKIRDQIAIH